MIFSWLKYRNSFISRSVRRQNMEWSNGVIFLIATFCPDGLCKAELQQIQISTLLQTNAGPPSFRKPLPPHAQDLNVGVDAERLLTRPHHKHPLLQHPEYHTARTHWTRSCAIPSRDWERETSWGYMLPTMSLERGRKLTTFWFCLLASAANRKFEKGEMSNEDVQFYVE